MGAVGESIQVRAVRSSDCAALAAIYNHYIEHSVISFEETPIVAAQMQERVDKVEAAALPWLVADCDGDVIGYAYAAPWNNRCAYRNSVEISIYLDAARRAQRLGTQLYERLFALLEQLDTHAVVAGIALPNDASVALHEKFGMRQVAHFHEIGYKFNQWIDVGYWQIIMRRD